MIKELVRTSVSKLPSYDRFESYELYPSNLNQPRKLLGYEDIFVTIVRGKLFRVRRFEFTRYTSDKYQYPFMVIVEMTDIYSNKSLIEFKTIKEYGTVFKDSSMRFFNVICNNREFFWIITDYLKSHGDKLDEDDMSRLHKKLHEFIILNIGDSK